MFLFDKNCYIPEAMILKFKHLIIDSKKGPFSSSFGAREIPCLM